MYDYAQRLAKHVNKTRNPFALASRGDKRNTNFARHSRNVTTALLAGRPLTDSRSGSGRRNGGDERQWRRRINVRENAAGAANPERNYRRGFVRREPEGWMDEWKSSPNRNDGWRIAFASKLLYRENVLSTLRCNARAFLFKFSQRVLNWIIYESFTRQVLHIGVCFRYMFFIHRSDISIVHWI